MIHASRQIVTLWANAALVRVEGGVVQTINGTIVVPGGGYDGSGPALADGQPPSDAGQGAIWAYATDLVQVRLGPVQTSPPTDQLEDMLRSALNRDVNTVTVLAMRTAGVWWDGCCQFAAEIDADACGIGGS